MDRDLEALEKARGQAEEHLREGRFEDAAACLKLIEKSTRRSEGRASVRFCGVQVASAEIYLGGQAAQ